LLTACRRWRRCQVEEADGPEEIGTRGIYTREIIIVSYKFPEWIEDLCGLLIFI
jgi:hypothetical protein